MILKKVADSLMALILGLIGAYGLVCLYALTLGDYFLFASSPATYQKSTEIIHVRSRLGDDIPLIYLPAKKNTSSRYTLLYSHGNLEDIGFIRPRLETFRAHGYNILSYDYPGFGIATGTRNEDACFAAAEAAYEYLTKTLNIPAERIIIYGRSMGSGPATYLASTVPSAGLILQSPFVSAFRVQTGIRLLPWDRFDNLSRIAAVRRPIFFVHGQADETIPPWHSEMLASAAKSPTLFLKVPFALHNNVIEIARDEYWQELEKFIALTEQNKIQP